MNIDRTGNRDQPSISAVTCLYDLGRGDYDGRSLDDYVGWLNGTLRLPLRFDIFLDPAISPDRLVLKPGDVIHRVPLSDFPLFAYRREVAEICARHRRFRTKSDITFTLPDYGLLVQCKLDMVERVADSGAGDAIFWLDAGLSRVLPDPTGFTIDRDFVASLGEAPFSLTIPPRMADALRTGRLSQRYVGTSTRLITGGDMHIARNHAARLAGTLRNFLSDEWIAKGRWDNEQTALGYLVFDKRFPANIVCVTSGYGKLARHLLGLPLDLPPERPPLLKRLLFGG